MDFIKSWWQCSQEMFQLHMQTHPHSNVTSALSHPLHFVTVLELLPSGIRSSIKFEASELLTAPHLGQYNA